MSHPTTSAPTTGRALEPCVTLTYLPLEQCVLSFYAQKQQEDNCFEKCVLHGNRLGWWNLVLSFYVSSLLNALQESFFVRVLDSASALKGPLILLLIF